MQVVFVWERGEEGGKCGKNSPRTQNYLNTSVFAG